MIKGSIQQEDITIINIYVPNRGALTLWTNINRIRRGYRMQCIHSRRLQHSTHSKGHINQTKNKETEALNNTLEQMDLTDIYRTLHIKAAGYTFFSSAHGTFSK